MKFKWLIRDQRTRNGKILKKGEIYDVKDFSADVVQYWVKSKVAQMIKIKENNKEK